MSPVVFGAGMIDAGVAGDAGELSAEYHNELAYGVSMLKDRECLESACESTTIAVAACIATWTMEL